MTEIKTKFICWGHSNCYTLDVIYNIIQRVKAYADANGYENATLVSVERDPDFEKSHERYDIEIVYDKPYEKKGVNYTQRAWQKLLLIDGEIVDGPAFHRRYDEFYHDRKAGEPA